MYLRQTLYLLQITQFEVSCLDFKHINENHKVSFTSYQLLNLVELKYFAQNSIWLIGLLNQRALMIHCNWWHIATYDTFVCFCWGPRKIKWCNIIGLNLECIRAQYLFVPVINITHIFVQVYCKAVNVKEWCESRCFRGTMIA